MRKLETVAERRFADFVRKQGYTCIKIQRRGWPDRLIQLDNGYSFYIEFKRQGEKPTKLQEFTHNTIRQQGTHVYVADTFEFAELVFTYELAWYTDFVEPFVDWNRYADEVRLKSDNLETT